MDAQKKEQEQDAQKQNAPEENHELGIKRVRTFAEDLALAKEKAGVQEPEKQKRKGGFFGTRRKKKEKIDPKKDLSKTQPEVDRSSLPRPKTEQRATQPTREEIEKELARSGIIEEKIEQKKEPGEEVAVPTLRTYKYDTAESIEKQGTSKISMLAAEQKRRVENKDFSHTFTDRTEKASSGRTIGLMGLSFVLIASGIGGALYFYNKSKVDTTEAVPVSKNILFTNDTIERDARGISGKDLVNLVFAAADSISARAGDLTEIELRDRTLLGEAKISKDTLFKKLEGSASSRLVRSFSDNYVIGAHNGRETSVFYLFKIEDFDTSFAGMLEWEEWMHLNLFGSFEAEPFVDEFIRNKDTRIQRDRFGNTKLIYAFPNSETLMITQNEEAFFELFERLTVSNATRN